MRTLILLLAAGALAGCAERLPSRPEPAPGAAAPPGPYKAGESYFGRNGYVEYLAGNAPVILTAPHGGSLTPTEIPDRTCGITVTDSNTREAVLAMRAEIFRQTGRYPHVVVNHLRRLKLDPNREIAEASCGDAEAQTAWRDYHAYVDSAKAAVTRAEGRGWYLDFHGHGHSIQRLELGYLLSRSQLNLSDAQLDAGAALEDSSSILTVSRRSPLSFSALLRGSTSLGSLYASEGFPAVPSASDPSPGSAEYFSGGYSTQRHSCALNGGAICGVQIEANFAGVRDTDANRRRFAVATTHVLNEYLHRHYGIRVTPIALRTRAHTSGGGNVVELKWVGATGTGVELRRNGALVSTLPNDGAYTDTLGTLTGPFDYRLCDAGTPVCSNLSSAAF